MTTAVIDSLRAEDHVFVDIYTARLDPRPDIPNGYKAWCIFRHPSKGSWATEFGDWPVTHRGASPTQAALNSRVLKRSGVNADYDAITEKLRDGYEKVPSVRGFYLNTQTYQVLNADRLPDWVLSRISPRCDKTPSPGSASTHHGKGNRYSNIEGPEWF